DLGNGVVLAFLAWLLTLLLAATAVAYRFYRDPERRAPDGDGVIVSPADGEVLYVRESDRGRLPVASKQGRAYSLQELTRTPLVRRIVAYVREGDEVAVGQRLGMIRFGSQVDLVLPIRETLRVRVSPGDLVRAGESTIAVLEDSQPRSA